MANKSRQIDSTINVVTPENIAFHYQAAGPFRRFPAFLIDVVIKLWLVWTFSMLVTVAAGYVNLPGLGIGASAVLYFIFDWFYGGFCETYMNGQTPGKWLLGIRVLTANGQPINGLQAVMRNVLRSLELMPLVSLEVFGLAQAKDGYVVVNEAGRPMRPESWSRRWRTLCRNTEGVGDGHVLHAARHSTVTFMRNAGVPDHVVAAWHGHDEVIMRRTYSHTHVEQLKSASSALTFGA